MKNVITAFLICLGLLGIGAGAALTWENGHAPQQNVGSDIGSTGFTKAATSSAITVTGTSGEALATSTSRSYSRLGNASTTGAVFCNANNGKAAVSGSGIYIAPSGTLILSPDDGNLYRGELNCITSGGNATLTVYDRL